MRIIVTGRAGQVARSLHERGGGRRHEVVLLGRPELDLTAHPDNILNTIEEAQPEIVVSAAAYTAVDQAETDPGLAFAVNERGAAVVAAAAKYLRVPLIHLSTDYVFDGEKPDPYSEDDATSPGGVYGASKLAGEQAVLSEHDNVAVLRTAWVYSPYGANFVKTMLRFAANRGEVRVVADQRGNPTSALDIADGILAIAENLLGSADQERRGLFHMTAAGEASWAEFAEAIFTASAEHGGPSATVLPITTAEYPTPAKRPANSRLDCSRIAEVHGVRLPEWRQSTKDLVARLVGDCERTGGKRR